MVNQPAWDSTSEELVRSSKTVEFHLQPLIDELNSLTLNAPTQDAPNKVKGNLNDRKRLRNIALRDEMIH
jgi:hypothetical protein